MANQLTGLFGLGLDDEEARNRALEDRNRNYAFQMARMSPDEAVSYQGIRGVQMAEDGLGAAVRGATGNMNASERMAAARQEIAARLQGQDMKDPLVAYPVIIEVLQKYGFIEEAMKAAKEFEELKLKAEEQKRKSASTQATSDFMKAKAAALTKGGFEAKMQAYADILNKLNDPTLSETDRNVLNNMKRAAESQLNIRDRNGIRVVPASKYGKGGSFQQESDGSWKWVEGEMTRDEPVGGSSSNSRDWRDMGYQFNEDGTQKRKVLENLQTGERKYGDWQPVASANNEFSRKSDANLELLQRLQATFSKNYVGGMFRFMPDFLTGMVQNLQRRFSDDASTQDELLWWQNYDDWYNRTLNMLSGAAVTESEAKRFKATIITRGMNPEMAEKRLQEQINVAAAGARKQRQGGSSNTPAPKPEAKPKPTKRFNPTTGKLEDI